MNYQLILESNSYHEYFLTTNLIIIWTFNWSSQKKKLKIEILKQMYYIKSTINTSLYTIETTYNSVDVS